MISKKLVLTIIRKYKEKFMYNQFVYSALVDLEKELEGVTESD